MFPFKSNIKLDRNLSRSLYLQLADQIIRFIKTGKLLSGTKMPGTRRLANDLELHRKTVVAAYEELDAQGWIKIFPTKGTFISEALPIIVPQAFNRVEGEEVQRSKSNFNFHTKSHLDGDRIAQLPANLMRVNDGDPDSRLAPFEEMARGFRQLAKRKHHQKLLAYGSIFGNLQLRKALCNYLNRTRGLNVDVDQVLITRGSQMGIFLAAQLLLKKGDLVVVGESNYRTSDLTFAEGGAQLRRIGVDNQGLAVEAIRSMADKDKIKALYTTSHHHHPTTVPLSAERRMELLQLAQELQFAVLEDDYDFDFHYANAPILPLASNDLFGNVLYIGAFTKIIAPAIRIGYLVGPSDFIKEAAKLRRIIDRQGDQLMEQVLARMLEDGDIDRHCNKVRKIYKRRRDFFGMLLKEHCDKYLDFQIPKGGMAFWVQLKSDYQWEKVYKNAEKFGLYFNNHWTRYDATGIGHQGIRMGFAYYEEQELQALVERLEPCFRACFA